MSKIQVKIFLKPFLSPGWKQLNDFVAVTRPNNAKANYKVLNIFKQTS